MSLLCAILLLCFVSINECKSITTNATKGLNYAQIIADEAYWISYRQIAGDKGRASGAITNNESPEIFYSVHPYEANIAARGMIYVINTH